MSQPLTGQELKNQFLHSESLVNDNRVQVPESFKMKLYGLGKQIKEGDCRMPQPPASNAILRSKWDAWTACAGMSIEKSMQEYISIVDSLEPGVRNPVVRKSIVANNEPAPGSVRKQGILYKQRDLFKGWRPRHFVLQDNFLHYYLEPDDPAPRNTLDLTGCSVTTSKSVTVDGVEYFPFVITHPKSKNPYNLSSTSKLEADTWVAKLLEAANMPVSQPVVVVSASETESKRPALDSANETQQDYFYQNTAHGSETRMYIPPDHLPRVEKSVQALIEKLSTDNGWELMFEKNGLVAKKKPGAVMCVKAEVTVPYNVFDVFATVIDPKRQTQLDPQRVIHENIKEFSNHTWVDYIRFKAVWPTSPRDMVNIAHWRLLNDGRVVVVAFSEKFDDIKPPCEGHVRAEALLGGFIFTPVAEGTKIQYLVETDLKGSLPASVVNLAANSQPLLLATLKKIMAEDRKNGKNNRALAAPADYADLVSFISNSSYEANKSAPGSADSSNKNAPSIKASTSSSSSSSSSSSNDKNSIPIQRRASLLKLAAKLPKVNTVALLMLFFPPLLYYVVDSKFRSVGFLAGLMIAFRYLFRKHLGKAIMKVSPGQLQRQLPGGKVIFRFPVELGRLLVTLNEKRTEHDVEVTITHVIAKACAMVINEIPTLNGHLVLGNFYRSAGAGVDISVAVAMNDIQSVAVKVVDADAKPVEYLANELIESSKAIRSSTSSSESNKVMERLSKILPPTAMISFKKFLFFLSEQYGISVPLLGIGAFPLGVCTVIAASTEGENDLDMAIVADSRESAAPITVTIGGLRISPSMDQDRKISGSPVLNMAVAVDSRCATTSEGRRFCARLQEFINDPNELEKAHKKYTFEREEAAKRKNFFGTGK